MSIQMIGEWGMENGERGMGNGEWENEVFGIRYWVLGIGEGKLGIGD